MKKSNDNTPVQAATGSFASLLAGIKRGEVLSDLDDALKETTLAVLETGKAGTITFKLKIKPGGKSNADTPMCTIENEIAVKKPRKSVGAALFYGDEEGNLFRNDPHQSEMSFGTVEGGKKEGGESSPQVTAAR